MANLYLHTHPFIEKDNPSARETHLLSYLSEEDKKEEGLLLNMLMNFAIINELVTVVDKKITHSTNENSGSWIWLVNWLNPRSLVDINQYAQLMQSLGDPNALGLDKLLDLHMRLGCLFQPELLNTLCHRTLTSVQLIPYDAGDNVSITTWEDIHTETPFLWVFILLQVVMKSQISPR